MHRVATIAIFLALAACSEQEEREIPPDIERMNELAIGPPVAIDLQPMTREDLTKAGRSGAGCSFSRMRGGPMLLSLDEDYAFFRHDDKFVRAASDVGSEELPFGAYVHYDGLENAVRISIDRETEDTVAAGLAYYESAISISDERDRTIFTATGLLECGA